MDFKLTKPITGFQFQSITMAGIHLIGVIQKPYIPGFLILLMICCRVSAQTNVNHIPTPNKQQIAWQQAELGFIFHYDLHVFDTSKYNQTKNRITPISDYIFLIQHNLT